jgi:RNA polymerase sigma-70 factor, ECF subfamily
MQFGPDNGEPQQKIDFNEYLDGLYGYAMVLSHNGSDAEDLVQETCLRALRGMGQLRPDGNVKSWLFTILRNVWLNQVRQRRTRPEMAELDLENGTADRPDHTARDPLALYTNKVEQEQVRAAIQQLPLEFREVIILREYEELSYQEIANLLDCPTGTVMSRLARARSRLRDLLSAVLAPRRLEENSDETSDTAA